MDGNIYMAQQGSGAVVQINGNGTFNQLIVSGLPTATGLSEAAVPGHLYVSAGNGIWDVNVQQKTAALFNSIAADGLSLSYDRKVLYAALPDRVVGFDILSKAQVFDSGAIPGADGTVLGYGALFNKLYVNTTTGNVVEIDLVTKALTVIASGGSRGDFVRAAPDGTLLVTQSDSIYRLIPPSGSSFGSGGPSSVAFYRGDPASGGMLIGTTTTSRALNPGEYEDVSVTWSNPPAGLHPVVVAADDDGTGRGLITEGDETNNKAGANVLLGIGPFPLVDSLISRFKDSSVDVLWTAVPGATGYNVYRRTGTGGPVLVKRAHTLTSYTDTGLTNGTPYYYLVRWLNAQGVESGDGTEASATPTRSPSAGNTPPTISSYPVVRARVGTLYSYQLRAGDPDVGDALTYSLVSPPSGMAISATGLVQWTLTVSHAGYQNIAVRVQDRTGRFTMQTYRLFVETLIVDGPPVITSTPITRATSGELYAYQVVARDPENGLVSYALTVAPSGMTVNANTGLVQWLSTRAHVGTHAVTVRVSDVAGNAATQSFTVQVERGNKPPTFTSTPATTSRVASPYVYAAAAIDPDGDSLTFSLLAGPAGMSVNATTGLVQWTPSAAQLGSQSVSLRVRDAFGLIADQNFVISVGPPNQTPSITSSPVLTSQVGVLYSYQVQVSDPNLPQDSFTFSLPTKPAGMVITSTTGLIQWVPPVGTENTNQSVTVTVTDLGGLTASQSFTVRVNAAGGSLPTVTLLGPANGADLMQDAAVTSTRNRRQSPALESRISCCWKPRMAHAFKRNYHRERGRARKLPGNAPCKRCLSNAALCRRSRRLGYFAGDRSAGEHSAAKDG